MLLSSPQRSEFLFGFELAIAVGCIEPRSETVGKIIDKAKGKIKQAAGKLSGNRKLERQGKLDEAKGEVKGAAARVTKAVKKTTKR